MPKILSYTPEWLSRPSPGYDVFAGALLSPARVNGNINAYTYSGPKRTIARRGTEIFVVVDNQIRWSDLCMLKEEWEDERARGVIHKSVEQEAGDHAGYTGYRVSEDLPVAPQSKLTFILLGPQGSCQRADPSTCALPKWYLTGNPDVSYHSCSRTA